MISEQAIFWYVDAYAARYQITPHLPRVALVVTVQDGSRPPMLDEDLTTNWRFTVTAEHLVGRAFVFAPLARR